MPIKMSLDNTDTGEDSSVVEVYAHGEQVAEVHPGHEHSLSMPTPEGRGRARVYITADHVPSNAETAAQEQGAQEGPQGQ